MEGDIRCSEIVSGSCTYGWHSDGYSISSVRRIFYQTVYNRLRDAAIRARRPSSTLLFAIPCSLGWRFSTGYFQASCGSNVMGFPAMGQQSWFAMSSNTSETFRLFRMNLRIFRIFNRTLIVSMGRRYQAIIDAHG